MLREVKLDKFPKKSSAFRPQILNSITVLERRPFDINIFKLIAYDHNYQQTYQLYIAKKLNKQFQENIQFIENTPNILALTNEPYCLVFEEHCQQTLKQYLAKRQNQSGLPFLNQIEAKQLLQDLFRSISSFDKNNLDYHSLTDHNVLRFNNHWTLSLASPLTNSFINDRNFYDPKRKGKQAIFFALGTLLFKMLFGFVPFQENNKKPSQFKFSTYIDYLQQQNIKKMLKIYHFAERIPFVSNNCKKFIEDCLSGKIASFQDCKHHSLFTQPPESPKKQTIQNKEIRMLNFFDKKYHSLIMASIDRRKKNQHQKLHPKMESDVAGFLQLKESFNKDPLLRYLTFQDIRTQSQIKREQEEYNNLKIQCKYFEHEFDFQERERPTLELIKFIDKDKHKNPDLYDKYDRQSAVKLYAFPYTMVFELANVYFEQPIDIKKKIQLLIPYLLQISSMHGQIDRLPCLHYTKQKHTKFQEIKIKYRELVNHIYKHFLNEAMKRYNVKKENLTITQKMRLKDQGLDYYKLCLKLMEVSLIVRKNGKDLDLQRIQTSQRKQIQQDLQNLLKTYFPNRVEIR